MRISTVFLMILTLLMGCNPEPPSSPEKTAPAPVISNDGGLKVKPAKTAPPPVIKEGGLTVLTADDIAKLTEDRKDLINRPSPMNEEADAVEAVRKQVTGK